MYAEDEMNYQRAEPLNEGRATDLVAVVHGDKIGDIVMGLTGEVDPKGVPISGMTPGAAAIFASHVDPGSVADIAIALEIASNPPSKTILEAIIRNTQPGSRARVIAAAILTNN